MQQKKVKELVLSGIAAFIALFTIIGMAFNLTQMEGYKSYEALLGNRFHESGFTMLGFKSDLIIVDEHRWLKYFLGVCGICQLFTCLFSVVLIICSYFYKPSKTLNKGTVICYIIVIFFLGLPGCIFIALSAILLKSKKACNIFAMGAGVAFSVLYVVNGVIFTSKMQDCWGIKFTTLSFIPLIIVMLAVAVYVAVDKLYKLSNNQYVEHS